MRAQRTWETSRLGRGGTALGEGTEFTQCVPGFGREGDTSLMGGKCFLMG